MPGHGHHGRVVGIEHGHARWLHVEHNHPLEHRQVFQCGDVVQAQVVTRTQVGHHGHLAAVKGQAFAQQATPGGLEHGGVHVGVHQDIAGAARAAAVARIGLAAIDIHAIGVGHAHAQALSLEQVGGQTHGGGFAVGAGHRNHRDAAIATIREHVVNDGVAHVPAFAKRGADVHAQARCGVEFDNAAVLFFKRARERFADHVHAANVDTHHLRRRDHAGFDLGVDFVGHVGGGAAGGQVGVVAKDHAAALGGDRLGLQVLCMQAADGDVVKTDFRQRGGMAFTPARVGVDLVDQLSHRVLAVAHHQRRLAACGGHQLFAHHQQAVIVAG